jgi:4-hydroxy-3-polyprenylbenzoate decarboxylase
MRVLIGVTGASGAVFGTEFVKRCPGEKYLIISDWGKMVMKEETGLTQKDLMPYVSRVLSDKDLAAPFSSGTNRYDAFVIIPCSISTLAKIAAGMADTLITRCAQVALKERMRLILCLRETPLATNALENAYKLSRDGVVIMPISPPFYHKPQSLEELVAAFCDKILGLLGLEVGLKWRSGDLE